METVNWYMLNDLLGPLGGSADSDEKIDQFKDFNNDDEARVKELIAEEIRPFYENASDAYKKSSKRSLSYFLTTNRIDFGRLYDSCLIAFEHPADPRDFFLWIWEVLFPDEDYRLANVENYVEVEDLNEPASYFGKLSS